MTIREARRLARVWRDRLGLDEWKLDVGWGKEVDDPDPHKSQLCRDCAANTWWMPEESKAIIILSREHADEAVIVHELLHIRMEGHRQHPARYDPLYERGINSLTEALIKTWAD